MKPLKSIDHKIKLYGMFGFVVSTILIVLFIAAVPQDPSYHLFADTRSLFALPNAADVLSNIPFVVVGALGLFLVTKKTPPGMIKNLRWMYMLFFLGVFFTGFGSAYYHLEPNNRTLVWDRLPMTLSFMPFFMIIWAENISERFAKNAVLPLIALGLASVIYWNFTESLNRGDLRPYAMVQFLPMLMIPLILLSFDSRFNNSYWLWLVILCYLGAKLFEAADKYIFAVGSLVSGHTIKHLFAALGTYCFYLALLRRQALPHHNSDQSM